MTQGLEALLNLPCFDDMLKEKNVHPDRERGEEAEAEADASEQLEEMLNIDLVKSLEGAKQTQIRLDALTGKDHAEAMDKLYKETLKHAQDLMDLGFNIDPPRARGIFEVATNMYGRSIEAKNSKRDAELRAMKLSLDQRKLALDERRIKALLGESEATTTIPGDATIIREDRNELIKRMRDQRERAKQAP